jgi:signal transduction histidine kinase
MHSDLAEVYTQLITSLRNLLACSGIAVLSLTEQGAVIPAQFGPKRLQHHIHLGKPETKILAHMARTRQALALRRELPFHPPLPTPADDTAWIGVPITAAEQLYGYLSMAGTFQPGDERTALALARQAAATLGWARRSLHAEGRLRQAHRLTHLRRRIHPLDNQTAALDSILDTVMSVTAATHSCILVSQHGRTALLARRGYSQDEAMLLQQIPPSLERGLTGRAYKSGAPARSNDILADPTALPALASTRSQLVIPIRSADQTLGLIDLQSPQPGAFHDVDESLLLAIGSITADVIEYGRARQPASGDAADIIQQNELLLSSRLAVVTDLAAGVAHEINNPLTTILGYTHLLLRDQTLPQTTRDDIGQIMVEGQRIATLVERFLRFAQPTSMGKLPLPVDEPVLEALGLLKSRLQESNIQVILDIPSEPPMVLGQVGQLEQAFLDLLQNAIEAMSAIDDRRLRIQIGEHNGWVRVAIADTGHGIKSDLLTRVFEPGFTTKVDKGIARGLGLGLYAAHTIIQDHRGRIEVQSQIQQGSTFTVCLPAI